MHTPILNWELGISLSYTKRNAFSYWIRLITKEIKHTWYLNIVKLGIIQTQITSPFYCHFYHFFYHRDFEDGTGSSSVYKLHTKCPEFNEPFDKSFHLSAKNPRIWNRGSLESNKKMVERSYAKFSIIVVIFICSGHICYSEFQTLHCQWVNLDLSSNGFTICINKGNAFDVLAYI